ncbi:MAG: hypothetical protein M3071_04150 [Actinomycetota bacterium]|nr:hypothetical protein [Actinomycetota bacterium]
MSVAEAAPAEGQAASKPSVAFVFAGLMLVLLMAAARSDDRVDHAPRPRSRSCRRALHAAYIRAFTNAP